MLDLRSPRPEASELFTSHGATAAGWHTLTVVSSAGTPSCSRIPPSLAPEFPCRVPLMCLVPCQFLSWLWIRTWSSDSTLRFFGVRALCQSAAADLSPCFWESFQSTSAQGELRHLLISCSLTQALIAHSCVFDSTG